MSPFPAIQTTQEKTKTMLRLFYKGVYHTSIALMGEGSGLAGWAYWRWMQWHFNKYGANAGYFRFAHDFIGRK